MRQCCRAKGKFLTQPTVSTTWHTRRGSELGVNDYAPNISDNTLATHYQCVLYFMPTSYRNSERKRTQYIFVVQTASTNV